MLDKIPFKVSARTARLIGRENVATAKGAIIELVKNGYDADSPFSIVLIDNRYGVYHNRLDKDMYAKYLALGVEDSLLASIYQLKDDAYYERPDVDIEQIGTLKKRLQHHACLYIIDAGEGMTESIIKNCWMTIGTDNKSTNYATHGGRVKAGAKGIGRFALDKLGEHCEMFTFFDTTVHEDKRDSNETSAFCGYHWIVNWSDFEGKDKTIDHVGAELEGISDLTYLDCLHQLPLTPSLETYLNELPLSHGTILKISGLRDIWDDEAIKNVYEDLGVLVPPSENRDFTISLVSLDNPQKYGEVESSFCDDFDYKIVAHANANQDVNIRIYRNEYNVEAIPMSF